MVWLGLYLHHGLYITYASIYNTKIGAKCSKTHKLSAWRGKLCSFNSLYVLLRSRQAILIWGESTAHRASQMYQVVQLCNPIICVIGLVITKLDNRLVLCELWSNQSKTTNYIHVHCWLVGWVAGQSSLGRTDQGRETDPGERSTHTLIFNLIWLSMIMVKV